MWIKLFYVVNYVQDRVITNIVITVQTIFPLYYLIQDLYYESEEFEAFAQYINNQTGQNLSASEIE